MIRILSPDLTFLGVLSNYESFRFQRVLRGAGDFELIVADGKVGTEHLQLGNILVINGTFAGFIVERELLQDSEVRELILRGFSLEVVLSYRRVLENLTEAESETISKMLVNGACVNATNADRNFQNFMIEPTQNRGTVASVESDFERLDAVLERVLAVDDFGYMVYIDSNEFVFDIIEPRDLTSSVQFSNTLYNLYEARQVLSEANFRNALYIQGETDAYEVAIDSPVGFHRREEVVFEQNIDDSAVAIDYGTQVLRGRFYKTDSIEAQIRVVGNPYTLGVDYDLGDFVTVRFGGTIYQVQVSMIEITQNQEGQNIDLGFGKIRRTFREIMRDRS